ncbi:MAG: hypothetical protein HZA93_19670 [Verrucomicrobia bacterium]|nr:hypothetical protein [Verrucomicrobiota bacterium]
MNDTLLQKFLDAGLFNFGDDDARLKDFMAAGEDLGKEFAKNPVSIIPATLVALDAEVPDADPMLERAETAVKKHWNSFRNKFPERQKGFLRPLLLDGVARAAATDADIASAVWLCGATVYPLLATGRERAIVETFLRDQGETAESHAEATWLPEQDEVELSVPKIALTLPKNGPGKLDKSALETGLTHASGPHDRNGTAYPNKPNPHFPNQGGNWSWEFPARAATTIAAEVDKALAPLANQAGALADQIEPNLKKFSKELGASITEWVESSVTGLARRSELLWWRECLYSPHLRRSYRGLSPTETAISMALDLQGTIVAPAPQSVEFFLRETVRAVLPTDPTISLSQLLADTHKSAELAKIVPPQAIASTPQRISLRQALGLARHQLLGAESLPAWLGVKGDLQLSASELAVWIFRDAQAWSLAVPPA